MPQVRRTKVDIITGALQGMDESRAAVDKALSLVVTLQVPDTLLMLQGAQTAVAQAQAALRVLMTESGAAQGMRFLRPVDEKYPIITRFGDPLNAADTMQSEGIVFDCPLGTPIVAPCDMRIEKASDSGKIYGKRIWAACVEQGPGGQKVYRLLFAHLDRIDVYAGQEVMVGEEIAATGATGNAEQDQLLFAVREEGNDFLVKGLPADNPALRGFIDPYPRLVRHESDVYYNRAMPEKVGG
jgi:murein DD-endopeptidase MepM/ murein hydrolase activator NlpD